MASLQQILGAKNLCGVIQGVKTGTPDDIPPAFLKPTKTVEGHTGSYHRVDGDRKLARVVQYGSPAKRRGLKGVKEVPVTLLHSFESQPHDPMVLQNLKQIGNEQRQKLGRSEITRQTVDFKRRFVELRKACVRSILGLGAIHFDEDGNLLPSSSGAAFSIDFGVPAGNKDQLDWDGNGAIISASWATAATKISTQIRDLKRAAIKLTGYPIKHAFYGNSILEYLLANTNVKDLISKNPNFNSAFAGGEIPDGFLGLTWHPMDSAFYEDENGDIQDLFGDDNVCFTPDPSPDWWDLIEGTYLVPNSIGNISADAVGALSDISIVTGMFTYAKITDNPVSIEQFAGDTQLPVLKVPKAIFIADVTP